MVSKEAGIDTSVAPDSNDDAIADEDFILLNAAHLVLPQFVLRLDLVLDTDERCTTLSGRKALRRELSAIREEYFSLPFHEDYFTSDLLRFVGNELGGWEVFADANGLSQYLDTLVSAALAIPFVENTVERAFNDTLVFNPFYHLHFIKWDLKDLVTRTLTNVWWLVRSMKVLEPLRDFEEREHGLFIHAEFRSRVRQLALDDADEWEESSTTFGPYFVPVDELVSEVNRVLFGTNGKAKEKSNDNEPLTVAQMMDQYRDEFDKKRSDEFFLKRLREAKKERITTVPKNAKPYRFYRADVEDVLVDTGLTWRHANDDAKNLANGANDAKTCQNESQRPT